MDGLDSTWEAYGCNEHDVIVGMAFSTNGNIAYWVNKHEVDHAAFTYESSLELVKEIGAFGFAGPIYVIYPDRSYLSTTAPHYYQAEPPFYYDYIKEAGCKPYDCDIVDIDGTYNKKSSLPQDAILINSSKIEISTSNRNNGFKFQIIDIKGRVIHTINRTVNFDHKIEYDLNKLAGGTYFIFYKEGDITLSKQFIVAN